MFSLALRIVEGVGSAAFYTASFTVATVLFPSATGTVVVYNRLKENYLYIESIDTGVIGACFSCRVSSRTPNWRAVVSGKLKWKMNICKFSSSLQADGFRLPFLVSGSSAMLFVFVFLFLLPRAGQSYKYTTS